MTYQGKLTTKLTDYSINDAIIELKNNTNSEQLNQIVKNVLKQLGKVDEKNLYNLTFDFIVGGFILRLPVNEHLELYGEELDTAGILSEKLIDVEYVLSLEAPEPLEAVPHEDWVSCVDANESYILTGSYDNTLRIFSIKDRKNLVTLTDAHEKPITRVQWLRNPSFERKRNELYFVSCGHDQVSILRKFDTKTLKLEVIFIYKGHNRSVNCVDCTDDLIATGSFDETLRLWSANEQDQREEEEENDEGLLVRPEVNGGSGSQKKKQKTRSGSDKSATAAGRARNAIMTLTGHQESITGVKWLGNCNDYNSLATCSMDRTICFWDVEVGECKRRVKTAKPLRGIDYSSENNLILSASCDKYVRVLDARAPDNATAKTLYTSHSAWVTSVAFGCSANHFISGSYDNLVKLWDLRSPKACLYDLIGHRDNVLDVNWKNAGYVLSGSADTTLKVFATSSSKTVATMTNTVNKSTAE